LSQGSAARTWIAPLLSQLLWTIGCARPLNSLRVLPFSSSCDVGSSLPREVDAKHLVYESVKPGAGGNVSLMAHLMLTPLELIERLAALILPPRHRHRYFGVLRLLSSRKRP
jgi:Putative transposase